MFVSAFCLTTNSIKNQYPVIESIKSFLPVVDELIVVDGGSTDGTIEAIEKINNPKIRIVSDEKTKWEEDWHYSRMGINSNRGLDECKGDIVIKFDIDFIMHEASYNVDGGTASNTKNFKKDLEHIIKNRKSTFFFTRRNFIMADRFFTKSKKTLGINIGLLKQNNVYVRYGLDTSRWGWGFEPISVQFEENGIFFGSMIRTTGTSYEPYGAIHNYDNTFSDLSTIIEKRKRHTLAIIRQQLLKYQKINQPVPVSSLDGVINNNYNVESVYKTMQYNNFKNKAQEPIALNKHPLVIQQRIKDLTLDKQGHSAFGWFEEFGALKSIYY